MDHAKEKQFAHWRYLFSHEPDDQYLAKAEQIGQVHARIGLKPAWYIGGYAQVLESIIGGMVGGSILGKMDNGRLGRAITALVKLSLLDISVAVSAYFKAEEERRLAVIDRVGAALHRMAEGDFAVTVEGLPGDYERIETDFRDMRQRISEALAEVAAAAGGISTGAAEIRNASNDLSNRTEAQAASLEESAAALSTLTQSAQRSAQDADAARIAVEHSRAEAAEGAVVVREAVQAMGGIQRSAVEIGKIVDVIDAIAFQTNLLALNASIEAARAGEAGRGFAVVAAEVRALAQRSADAAHDIKGLVESSGEEVTRGVALVGRSGEAFHAIVDRVLEVAGLITEIAELAGQQALGVGQVNAAMHEMDIATQQNAAMAEESTAAAANLAAEAQRLDALVRMFKLSQAEGERSPDEAALYGVSTGSFSPTVARFRQSANVLRFGSR